VAQFSALGPFITYTNILYLHRLFVNIIFAISVYIPLNRLSPSKLIINLDGTKAVCDFSMNIPSIPTPHTRLPPYVSVIKILFLSFAWEYQLYRFCTTITCFPIHTVLPSNCYVSLIVTLFDDFLYQNSFPLIVTCPLIVSYNCYVFFEPADKHFVCIWVKSLTVYFSQGQESLTYTLLRVFFAKLYFERNCTSTFCPKFFSTNNKSYVESFENNVEVQRSRSARDEVETKDRCTEKFELKRNPVKPVDKICCTKQLPQQTPIIAIFLTPTLCKYITDSIISWGILIFLP